MLYFSTLQQETAEDVELWIRINGTLYPIYDYKIVSDQLQLVSNPDSSVVEAVSLLELNAYVQEDGTDLVPYVVVDEATGRPLDVKDRFSTKLVFEICN